MARFLNKTTAAFCAMVAIVWCYKPDTAAGLIHQRPVRVRATVALRFVMGLAPGMRGDRVRQVAACQDHEFRILRVSSGNPTKGVH
jgi:hypothetical protein